MTLSFLPAFAHSILISGLVKLFLFQALGELLSNFLIPLIPGPVIGLVLLLAFLLLARRLPADIDGVGHFPQREAGDKVAQEILAFIGG